MKRKISTWAFGLVLMALLVMGAAPTKISNSYITLNGSVLRVYDNDNGVYSAQNEALNLINTYPHSKAFIGWSGYYNNSGTVTFKDGIAWMGAHFNSTISSDPHQHFSIEAFDTTTGFLNSRFILSYGLPNTEMYARFTNIDEVQLGDGVDLIFTSGNIENRDNTLNVFLGGTTDKGLAISNSSRGLLLYGAGYDQIWLGDDLAFSDAAYDILHEQEMDIFPKNSSTIGFRFDTVSSIPTMSGLGSALINVADSFKITGELNVTGISGDGTGRAVCIKADGNLGTCQDAVGAGGTCTCA